MTMVRARQFLFVGGALLKGVVEMWALRRARKWEKRPVRHPLPYSRN
ncbi:MAG TPA: hypothetical protein VFF82_00775 [Rhodocyclaceae bacterium]|nr:hypothetical protein [Rhodocyclaceae bacterium]